MTLCLPLPTLWKGGDKSHWGLFIASLAQVRRPTLSQENKAESDKYSPLASTGPVSLCTGTHRNTHPEAGCGASEHGLLGSPQYKGEQCLPNSSPSSQQSSFLVGMLAVGSVCNGFLSAGSHLSPDAWVSEPQKQKYVGIVGQPRREQGSGGRP